MMWEENTNQSNRKTKCSYLHKEAILSSFTKYQKKFIDPFAFF